MNEGKQNQMSGWKRTGWIALGVAPVVAVFLWQVIASAVGMIVYEVYRAYQATAAGVTEVDNDQIIADFLDGTGMPYSILMFSIYVGYLIIFGLWYGFMFVRKQRTGSWKQVWKPQRILGIIGCGIALQLFLSIALTVILPLLPKLQEQYAGLMDTLGSDSVFMMVCVCLLAPIGEELIFRGLSLRIFRKAIPWQAAVIAQALLFGIYHMNLVQGVYATLLGLILGYTAYRYGSVLPGMLLHIVINSSSYGLNFILPASIEDSLPGQIVAGGIGMVVAIGCLLLYVRGVKPAGSVKSTATN